MGGAPLHGLLRFFAFEQSGYDPGSKGISSSSAIGDFDIFAHRGLQHLIALHVVEDRSPVNPIGAERPAQLGADEPEICIVPGDSAQHIGVGAEPLLERFIFAHLPGFITQRIGKIVVIAD